MISASRLRKQNLALMNEGLDLERESEENRSRIYSLLDLTGVLLNAETEQEVVQIFLDLLIKIVDARGASFVSLDDRGQPVATTKKGEFPYPHMEAWLEYLASPKIRKLCQECSLHETLTTHCQLMDADEHSLFHQGATDGVFCIPLACNKKELGIINIFIPSAETIDDETNAIIKIIADESALVIERIRMKENEMNLIQRMQGVRNISEITTLLSSLLDSLHENIDVDFAVLALDQSGLINSNELLLTGEIRQESEPIINGVLESARDGEQELLISDLENNKDSTPYALSIVGVPLLTNKKVPIGMLLAGKYQRQAFQRRQLPLLKIIASNMVMVIQNASTLQEVVLKTTMEERTRIAREIHDGLAQTLGYLKLLAAKMSNYIARDEYGKISDSLSVYYRTLGEAYQDAREAIDNLRADPYEKGIGGWLAQSIDVFAQLFDANIYLEQCEPISELLPEIHTQLIRIVQEALSNVRKHSRAKNVWVSCHQTPSDLILEIKDDGVGFLPEDVSVGSHYGLESMRERAELIEADFQIISNQEGGTTVRVVLPLRTRGVLSK
jgi:two-component system nitrate/nitrite sensor histidine kinase NarX